jgi:hypothetical protein
MVCRWKEDVIPLTLTPAPPLSQPPFTLGAASSEPSSSGILCIARVAGVL